MVGVVVAIALIALALLWYRRTQKRRRDRAHDTSLEGHEDAGQKDGQSIRELDHKNAILAELNQDASRHELHGDRGTLEMADPASEAVVAELDART